MATESSADWTTACMQILDAQSEGPDRVFAVLVAAARRLAATDGACVISWQQSGPRALVGSGPSLDLPTQRLTSSVTTHGNRSVASVPIRGELDLVAWRSAARPQLSVDDVEALRVLATLAATAVQRTEVALSSLYGVARHLLASRDLEEVLLEIVTSAAEVLRAEIAGVFLVTPEGDRLQAKAVVGNRTIETARLSVKAGQGLVGHVFRVGTIYRVDDWTTDPVISKEFLRIANMEGTQSCIGAPMLGAGQTMGVLAAWRRRRSLFTDDDVEVMRALADLAAVAVERAVATEALRDVSLRLTEANDALADRYEEAQQTLRVHAQLTRVVVDGAELPAVVTALAELTGREIALVGFEGTVVSSGATWLSELVQASRHQSAPSIGTTASLLCPDPHFRHAVGVTVHSGGFEWGEIAVASESAPLTRDIVAAEQAAVACALLLSRHDAVAAAVRRLESEFVWDLLEGRVHDEAEAMVRARQLARELPSRSRVVLVSTDVLPALKQGDVSSPEQLERLRSAFVSETARLLETHGLHARCGRRGDSLAVIVPDRGSLDRVRELGHEIFELGTRMCGRVRLGISAPVEGIADYPTAYRQATYAVSASGSGELRVALFEDLGVVQFLLEPAQREDLDRYVEQLLGPLIAYDHEHGSDLVNTLAAYLESDCHLQRAAAALFIHHKTMSYRLTRIGALTGLHLERQEDRFNIQLALKILSLRHYDSGGTQRSEVRPGTELPLSGVDNVPTQACPPSLALVDRSGR